MFALRENVLDFLMLLNSKRYLAVQYRGLSILRELVFSKAMNIKNYNSKIKLVW
jgi:hypothetical protein